MISRRRFLVRCSRCALALPWAATAGSLTALGAGPAVGANLAANVDRWTRTVCDLCGLAEPVFVGTANGIPALVKGIARSRSGYGRLCPRARAIVEAARGEDRALRPLLRRDASTKGTREGLEPVSWEEALTTIRAKFGSVRERLGRDGVAFVASDGETCETYHRMSRFVRIGMGTDLLDTPARLDALHAYDACGYAFGVEANPASVEDVDAADLIFLVGGDFAESHPGLYYRVLDVRRAGRAKVVLIDWRKTLAASVADVHVRARPGGELALVNALAAELLDASPGDSAAVDATSAPGAPWRAWLRNARRGIAASLDAAGVKEPELAAIVDAWRNARSVVTLVGPTALGAPNAAVLARAVSQLHRATDQWGRVGRGCLFLPRGANATGVVALGIRPGRLPAGGRLTEASDRRRTAAAWDAGADAFPDDAGRPLFEWPAAVREGRLGAIFVLRANVAAELPDARAWRDALTQSFTVSASTHVPTETTVFADLVLPLALVSPESAGTMMTLDRRCQLLAPGAAPPGEAKTADELLIELARSFDLGSLAGSPDAAFEWDRFRAIARGTPYDTSGVSPARLREELDVSWPCGAESEPGTPRIGAAAAAAAPVFVPTPTPRERLRPSRPDGAFLLVTGPLREHAGSRVRTGRTAELHYEAPAPLLEMHPSDGGSLGLTSGEWVTVTSDVGSATARLWLTGRVIPGVVFLPEHFGFLSDLQGGSSAQKEPEGLAHLVTSGGAVADGEAPAGLHAEVTIRKARRRDMRDLGI